METDEADDVNVLHPDSGVFPSGARARRTFFSHFRCFQSFEHHFAPDADERQAASQLSKENKSWTYPVPQESIPLNCRRKGHAYGQCVGPEARWVLRNIRSLMRQAHASSYLAEDSTVINTLSQPEFNGSSLQKTACQHGPIQGCVTRKPFYHQRTSTDAAGVLRTKWASFAFEEFVFDFFSFACIPDRSLTKKAEGFAVAFARVSPIATDQLYRPLHLDRAGRGGEPVFLYDEHGKRGWLVPKLSVLLHLVRASMNY